MKYYTYALLTTPEIEAISRGNQYVHYDAFSGIQGVVCEMPTKSRKDASLDKEVAPVLPDLLKLARPQVAVEGLGPGFGTSLSYTISPMMLIARATSQSSAVTIRSGDCDNPIGTVKPDSITTVRLIIPAGYLNKDAIILDPEDVQTAATIKKYLTAYQTLNTVLGRIAGSEFRKSIDINNEEFRNKIAAALLKDFKADKSLPKELRDLPLFNDSMTSIKAYGTLFAVANLTDYVNACAARYHELAKACPNEPPKVLIAQAIHETSASCLGKNQYDDFVYTKIMSKAETVFDTLTYNNGHKTFFAVPSKIFEDNRLGSEDLEEPIGV